MWWFLSLKPILSQKWADFVLFEKAVYLIKKGAHLTTDGLTNIISIKASMNKGLSDKLLAQFPDISLVERAVLIDRRIINGNRLAGFTFTFFFIYIIYKKKVRRRIFLYTY